ncbi:MAG: Uma2 family endonuclease, partial [Acidimicrobiales bacterium]
VVKRLNRFFSAGLDGRAVVGVQDPVRFRPDCEPQPDLSVLVMRDDDYSIGHPGPGDVLLLVEVCDTSGPFDRVRKIPLYAQHGVPEVWLVDIPGVAVEAHTEPVIGGYGTVRRFGAGDTVSPGPFPDLVLAVSDLFP